MQSVAIVGVGLIGASFGLALRRSGFTGPIFGVSSPAAVEAGIACGAISRSATLDEAAMQADLIYLSQPVDRILETLKALGPIARRGILVTDAGSTKASIVRAAGEFQSAVFIGGHPMAGKETRGAQSAAADLFQGRPYVLTPDRDPIPGWFRTLLTSIGASVIEMTAEEHDRVVALTSHLPQLISTTLAAYLSKHDQPEIQQVFGSGLMDMTRLALSPAELWSSILSTNKANVGSALGSYADEILKMKRALEEDRIEGSFNSAAGFASSLRKQTH